MATITKDDIKVFNVSNKFGFLNISDSDEDEATWLKAKKSNQSKQAIAKNTSGAGQKKAKPVANNNVIGLNAAPSENIITPAAGKGEGLSKNAKRRARKKKQAEDEQRAKDIENTPPPPPPEPTEDELFQKQLEAVLALSKTEEQMKMTLESVRDADAEENADSETPKGDQKKKKKKKVTKKDKEDEEEGEEEEEEDLFMPVIEDIKDVIRKVIKEDEIPITEIPIDNGELLRKRALELDEINKEFKTKLNSLLKVGYKYKSKYMKARESNKQYITLLHRSEGSKKVDLVQNIVSLEERETMLIAQISELTQELEQERTKNHALEKDNKGGVKKVSFSES